MTTTTPRTSPTDQPDDSGGASGFARIRLGGGLAFTSDPAVAALYAITSLLVGIGLTMVLSSSSITSYLADQGFLGGFWRQATYALIGLPLMLVVARVPMRYWKKLAWLLLGLGIVLQLLVFSPIGVEVYGNRNWIQIGSISGQPSELLKLAFIVWVGAVLMKKEPLLGRMRHELIPIILPGALIVLGLVLYGRDLGTTLIMGMALIGALFFGGVSWKSLGLVIVGAALAAAFFVVSSQNRMDRLLGHASGNDDYSGLGWQPLHGLWALAGGGLFGVGLGGSKAKWSWLPAADNDYIFSIIGEELGLVGAVLVILLFVALAVVMLHVIGRARDRFGKAVVGGILVWIVGQAFVNIGVVIGVFPVLGVPLPLISSGGTALIACLLAIGVVISIARDAADYQREKAA
jgi:cell division protein FtsW